MRRPLFTNTHSFLPDGVCDMVHEFLRTKVKDKYKECTSRVMMFCVKNLKVEVIEEHDDEEFAQFCCVYYDFF